jgi:hypothetical protein
MSPIPVVRVARPFLALLLSCCVAVMALAACSTTTVHEISTEAGADPTLPSDPADPGAGSPGDPQVPDPPACKPSCTGKACGGDGCGGSCGTCKSSEKCNTNKGTCAATCTPSCTGLACGSDGCGGSCGTCATGTCKTGECQCTQDSDCGPNRVCGQDTSGNHGCSPVCDPFDASTCTAGQQCSTFAEDGAGRLIAACVPVLGAKIENEPCTDLPNFAGSDCAPGLSCVKPSSTAPAPVCMRFCNTAHACPKAGQTCVPLANGAGAASAYSVCGPPMGPCTPNPCTSANKNVCTVAGGAAQCACNAGYSDQAGACVKICVPSCAGKTCGSDGCGGSCGSCAAPATCKASGQCCAANCAGKTCGPDGCGGTCGACGAGQLCSATGTCNVCTPSCAGKTCGPDGCGGSCGFCNVGVCNGAGTCACTPHCAGKNCGDDGCGGTCGACTLGKTCAAGLCTDPNFCSGAPCYAAFSAGGCCASSGYCVRGAAQVNSFCRSTCGKSGEGCRGDGDCCGPLSCFGNVCQ